MSWSDCYSALKGTFVVDWGSIRGQLGERKTEDLKVTSSILVVAIMSFVHIVGIMSFVHIVGIIDAG